MGDRMMNSLGRMERVPACMVRPVPDPDWTCESR